MHQGLQRPVRQAAEDGVLFVARRIDQALVVGLEAVGCAPLAMIDSRCRNFLMTAPVVNQSVDAHAVPPAAHQGTVLHPLVVVTDGDSVGAHRHRFHLVRRRPLLQGPPLDQRQGTDWKSQTSINSRGRCEPNRGPPDRALSARYGWSSLRFRTYATANRCSAFSTARSPEGSITR